MNSIFDIHTLCVNICLTQITLSLCMIYYSFSRKTYQGFSFWTIGSILHALGFLLMGFRENLPEIITIVFANALGFTGMFFFYLGFKSFASEKVRMPFHLTLILIYALAIFPVFTYALPSLNTRIVIASFATAFYFILSILVCIKAIRQAQVKSNKLLIATLSSFILIYLSRGLFFLFPANHVTTLESAGLLYEVILLLTAVLSISFIISLMQLNSQKLEQELSNEKKELIQNREKFISLSSATFEGIAINRNGTILETNESMDKMFGYSFAEMTGMELWKLVATEHRQKVKHKLFSDHEGIYETVGLKKDRSEFPLEIQIKLFEYKGWRAKVAAMRDITQRKQAEEELGRLGAAVRQSPLSILMTDLDGNIKYVNPKFCEQTGYSVQELMGGNPRVLKSGKMNDKVYRELWQTITAGREWRGELYNKKRDGSFYWEKAIITPIFDESKRISCFLGMKEDITERKSIEDALRKSETKFKTLVESSNDWIWEVNTDYIYTYASPQVETILGYRPEEIVGQAIFDQMPQEEAKRVEGIYKKVAAESTPLLSLENIYLHKKGHQVILETNGLPVHDETGTLTSYIGIDRDITDRKQSEQKLKESQRKYKQLVEDIGPVSFLFSRLADGTVTYVSPSVGKILGLKPEEIIGQHWRRLPNCAPNSFKKIQPQDMTGVNKDKNNDFELSFTHPSGELKTLQIQSHSIWDESGKTEHIEGIATDISIRKKAEQKQAQINEMLEAEVKKRTAELENLNTALKVLLKKREEDKLELEEKVSQNYESVISPFLEKLKTALTDTGHRKLVSILESNLEELVSPFSMKLSDPLKNLTPSEIQIASLIKQGLSNKEISTTLHIAVRTVTNHRNNIRKKLGLVNKKINLRSYLSSL